MTKHVATSYAMGLAVNAGVLGANIWVLVRSLQRGEPILASSSAIAVASLTMWIVVLTHRRYAALDRKDAAEAGMAEAALHTMQNAVVTIGVEEASNNVRRH